MNVASWKLVLECSALRRDACVFFSCLLSIAALGRMSTPPSADYLFVVRLFDWVECSDLDYVDGFVIASMPCVEYYRYHSLQRRDIPCSSLFLDYV